MRYGGYALFIAGVVLTALLAVPENINWFYFAISALSAALGAFLSRKSMMGREEVRLSRGNEIKAESFFQIAVVEIKNNISELVYSFRNSDINSDDLKRGIEDIGSAVMHFVENRESLAILYGFRAGADIITRFSAGERSVARAWSELVDGYTDEALGSLEGSLVFFSETLALLKKCRD
jgi:hypothetical protein